MRDLWDTTKHANLHTRGISEREKKKWVKIIFEEIMAESSPNLKKETDIQAQEEPVYVPSFSAVSDSVTLWTVAHQAPLATEFSRQECWNGLPFPTPGDLPNPGIEPPCPELQAAS